MTTSTAPQNVFVDFKHVKSSVTLLQVLERYDLIGTLKRTADRLSGPCPLHRGSNPTQFRVSVSRNCFNCFGACGRGGNVIDFVSLREGIPIRDAALLLQKWFMPETSSGRLAEATPLPSSSSLPVSTGHPPQPPKAAEDGFRDESVAGDNPPLSFELKSLKQDHPYTAERGLTEATAKSYGVGYCSRGCLRGYLAIPVRNRAGELVAYIGRWPGEPPAGHAKYKLPKGFRKSLELFNLDRALHADSSLPLIVVEGVFDCLHLVQLGYPRTVALLGSSLSDRQEALLREAAGPRGTILLLLDADAAGRKGAADAAGRLCRFCTVRIINVGESHPQPEQLNAEEAATLISA